MRYILYLHGFHSSPNSHKAVVFKRAVEEHFNDIQVLTPQVKVLPIDAIEQINAIMESYKDEIIGIVGSSLGGYLATYLHNEFNKPIVVINPAVKPFELLHDSLGEQVQPITGEVYSLGTSDMTLLKSMYQQRLFKPEWIWLLQQEKDEVLDYREALERYQGCKVTFELGGSHGFEQFERYPLQLVEFLNKSLSN